MSSAVRHDTGAEWPDPADLDHCDGAGLEWDDLSADEQDMLLTASTEAPMWALYERIGAAPLRRAATGLAAGGLIWFYRLDDGYPDLAAVEVASLCGEPWWWDRDGARTYSVGVYLTDAGEALFPTSFEPTAD